MNTDLILKNNSVAFKASKGANFDDDKAKIYGNEISKIIKNQGKVTPTDLVILAGNKNSPLHNYFEWNDSIAAQRHRIDQARYMLNHIVTVVEFDGKPLQQRCFYNVVNADKERVYVNLKTVIETPDYVKQLIKECIKYIDHFKGVLSMLKDHL